MATIIAVYANWGFARISGIGWGWAGVIWIFSLVTYFPLDILKFITRLALSGKAWDNFYDNKVYIVCELFISCILVSFCPLFIVLFLLTSYPFLCITN